MSVSDDLTKLSELHASGALSQDEFTKAKHQILRAAEASTSPPSPVAGPASHTYAQPGAKAGWPAPAQPIGLPHGVPAGAAQHDEDRWLPEYYQGKFAGFDAQGGSYSATWNWAAFFFGVFWYLVKGMWAKALIIFFLVFVAGGFLTIPLAVYTGVAGNYDYYLFRRHRKHLW